MKRLGDASEKSMSSPLLRISRPGRFTPAAFVEEWYLNTCNMMPISSHGSYGAVGWFALKMAERMFSTVFFGKAP